MINDNYWQTETGFPIVSNFMNLEYLKFKPGSATKPVPGYNLEIIGENGQISKRGEMGRICVKLPTPPCFMTTLFKNDQGFVEKYF